jgi:hypothetical protein
MLWTLSVLGKRGNYSDAVSGRWLFHFDDIGAERGELSGSQGGRYQYSKVEDLDPGERLVSQLNPPDCDRRTMSSGRI